MITNQVLSQLPKAQEAYVTATKTWDDVNTTDLLLYADKVIREQAERGLLTAQIGGISDIRVAEKAAIELAELGYWTNANVSGQVTQLDGTVKMTYCIQINWIFMAINRRDAFTI